MNLIAHAFVGEIVDTIAGAVARKEKDSVSLSNPDLSQWCKMLPDAWMSLTRIVLFTLTSDTIRWTFTNEERAIPDACSSHVTWLRCAR